MRCIHAGSRHIGSCVVLPFLLLCATATASPLSVEDLLQLNLEDLVNVRVSVTSHFVESQLDAGSTVSAVTDEQWRQRGARRLYEAVGHLPGVIVIPNLYATEQITIRGYADANNRHGVATQWDGVTLPSVLISAQTARPNISLGTLDRIELIRGPGSALHGENAFHGVLALHAFESTTDVTRLDTDVATNGYYQTSVNHSQALGGETRMHASAAFSGQPDQHLTYRYFDPPGISERAFKHQSATAVVKFTSDPNQKLTWNGGLYLDDTESHGFLGAGTSGATGLDELDQSNRDSQFWMARGGLGYAINATTASQMMLYHTTQYTTVSRFLPTTLPTPLNAINKHDETETGAQLVIHQQALLGNTNWGAALSARHQGVGTATLKKVETDGTVVANINEIYGNFSRDITSMSFDANSAFAGDTVHLRYGMRVDSYSDVGTHVTPRLGVIYQPQPDTALKLLYGEGFRAPSASEVKGSLSGFESNPNIKPEEIKTLELAYLQKTERSLTELVLFKSRWVEAISLVPSTTPGFAYQFVNTGKSAAYGAEASFTQHNELWSMETSASYVRSENITTERDYTAFPTWILNAGVGYRFAPYATQIFVNQRVHLDADESKPSPAYIDPAPLKDYWRTDVHVATQLSKKAAVTYDIRNLFDRHNAWPSIQPNPSPGGTPDEGRSVLLGVRYTL